MKMNMMIMSMSIDMRSATLIIQVTVVDTESSTTWIRFFFENYVS